MVVPGVLNLSEDAAKQKIETAGFEFASEKQASATIEAGLVVRQSPEEGNKLAKGEKVTVFVSSGKGKVEVPILVGKSQTSASNELGKLGLGVNPQTEATDDEKMIGMVIRQSPESGQMLEAGDDVTIIVGVANETIAVPRVIGMNKDAALSYLSQMGLTGTIEEITSTSPGGTVVDQTPKEGEKVQKGSTVTIYVSNAPEVTTVKVPAVGGLGLTLAQAKAKLQLYGLTWKITPYYVDQPEPGIVLGQNPVAGDEVEKGSIVELFVSETPPTTTTTLPPTTDTTRSPDNGYHLHNGLLNGFVT